MLQRPLIARARRGIALLTTSALALLVGAGAAHAAIPFDLGTYDSAAQRFDAPSSDRAGRSIVGDCDVTGDGRPDAVIAAPEANTLAGRVYVVPGSGTRAPGSYALSGGAPAGTIRIDGDPADGFAGASIACAGDVNDDGSDDIVIGVPGRGASGAHGKAHVVFGGPALVTAGAVDLAALGTAGFTISGQVETLLGLSVAGLGDLNGDGLDEVAVADDWGDDRGGAYPGTVYVVAGQRATTPIDLTQAGSTLLRISGAADSDRLEVVASAGDVNRDRTPDLLVGASSHDGPNGADSGAVYVVDGRATGAVDVGRWDDAGSRVLFPVWGATAGGRLGGVLAPAGDVNGDGRADIALGLPASGVNPEVRGSVAIVYGKSGDDPVDLGDPGASAALIRGLPASSHDGFGASGLASAGDVNGDGRADLLVGAPRITAPGGENAGAAYLLYGTASSATRDVADLTCESGARLYGSALGDQLGVGAASAGAGFTSANAPTLLVGADRGFVRTLALTDVPDACGRGREPEPVALDVDFGFRENFRRYVTNGFNPAAPAVPIDVSNGAACDPNPDTARGGCDPRLKAVPSDPLPQRALRWTPVGAGATDGTDTTVATIGKVTFRYPGHFFTLAIEDPWFVIAGGQVTLRARVDLDVADGFAGARSADVRVNLGSFPLDGRPVIRSQYVVWRTQPGVLTDEAAVALGGFLGRGAELDPVTIAIPRSLGPLGEEPGVPQPPGPPAPPPPGPPAPPRPPVVVDPPQRAPRAAATVTAVRRTVTLRRAGAVSLATVRCAVAECRVSVPRQVRVRVGRARVALRLSAPAKLKRGKRASVRLTVSRAALRRLAGRSVKVRVPITVRAGGRRVAKTVTVTLKVAKAANGRR